ncbi:hypothetical protein KI387_018479, partial [Taxus chinensis]
SENEEAYYLSDMEECIDEKEPMELENIVILPLLFQHKVLSAMEGHAQEQLITHNFPFTSELEELSLLYPSSHVKEEHTEEVRTNLEALNKDYAMESFLFS